ncbi:MAG: hypothetical protein HY898_16395 [Deltaproteobacteria bacterium]|nr:hypothetical protein [Deltaproteobacteria bacterium]
MLGERIGEFKGRITGMRVLPAQGGAARLEVCMEQQGTLLGVECREIGTYVSVTQPDGSLQGEAHGVTMTKDGESSTWVAYGTGHFVPGKPGATSWRGCAIARTSSAKLSRLNGLCMLFEHECSADGTTVTRDFEWR